MTPADVRQQLIEALRLDLVGPDCGLGTPDEVLPQAPSRWYLTGFLVPTDLADDQKAEEGSTEGLDEVGDAKGLDDAQTPEPAAARRAFLPSSIGMSLLIPNDTREIGVTVRWGDYQLNQEGDGHGGPVQWKRTPREERFTLAIPERTKQPVEKEVPRSAGLKVALSVRPIATKEADGGLPKGTRSVSLFVVNRRKPAADERRDEAFAFQAQLEAAVDGCLVPRPDLRSLESEDWDERVADLQYRDDRECAVGHNVATEAFILMNLPGMADPLADDREVVDLLFFPTGGGKTEAYLGLAAFTLVLRRLRNPGIASAGVTVLIRYTLRLLTLDQLGRASTLICALELERQKDVTHLGEWPFEIGLWVGQAATPNRMGRRGDQDSATARAKTIAYKNNERKASPIPLEDCPWCGTKFNQNSFELRPNRDNPTDLRIKCVSRHCEFSSSQPLPIVAVDEPIYRRLPCFLIATVDKFAAMPWTGEVGAFFGRVERHDGQGFYGPCEPGRRPGALERPWRRHYRAALDCQTLPVARRAQH